MQVIQVRLRHLSTERVCWVENKKITIGKIITLEGSEDSDTPWEVIQLGDIKELKDIPKGWKVGGL
jgi:hypothetical protein